MIGEPSPNCNTRNIVFLPPNTKIQYQNFYKMNIMKQRLSADFVMPDEETESVPSSESSINNIMERIEFCEWSIHKEQQARKRGAEKLIDTIVPMLKNYVNFKIDKAIQPLLKENASLRKEVEALKKKVREMNKRKSEIVTPQPAKRVKVESEKKISAPLSDKVIQQLKRLNAIYDPLPSRKYRGIQIPSFLQFFLDHKFLQPLTSPALDISTIKFDREFLVPENEMFSFMNEHKDGILIGEGECYIAARMEDKNQDFADFNIYILDSDSDNVEGPMKLSHFLESCEIKTDHSDSEEDFSDE